MLLRIPIRAKPTPRPRVRAGQRSAYYPKAYQSYKNELEWLIKQAWVEAGKPETEGPYAVSIIAHKDSFLVTIQNSWHQRQGVRGDIDNIQKGCLDALQTVGLIDNDRNVHSLSIRFG